MNVFIRIDYTSNENMVTRKGSFPLKRKRPEEIGLEFWKLIKSQQRFECHLEKVIFNSEEDLTDKVKEMEKAPLE